MKKHLASLFFGLLIVISLHSCTAECLDTPEEIAKNEFLVNWIKAFGLIDGKQDWNMARRITADIDVESFGGGKTLYVYNADPAEGGALMGVFSSPRTQNLDIDKNTYELFVRAYDADKENFTQYTFDIIGDRVQINGALSRAEVMSRADDGNSLGSPYQWILACEDLGATDDTDFNDIVIGLSYIAGDNAKLKVTPLAAGGVFEAEIYFPVNGTPVRLFEIHQALGSSPCASGDYKMRNTRSWMGAGTTSELTVGDDFTVTEGMGGFSFKVTRPDTEPANQTVTVTLSAPVAGEAPQVICVPGNWEWPSERTSITDAYPEFHYWSKDAKITDWNSIQTPGAVIRRISDTVHVGQLLEDQTFTINSQERKYDVYIPNGIKANAPVVFSLHGAGNSKEDQMPFKPDYANTAKCIVVYPQGLDINFPIFGGNVAGWAATGEANTGNDDMNRKCYYDLEFFKAIIQKLSDDYQIDLTRVYCCGFSNGGMMTYAMSTCAADIFAAFASIEGIPMNEFHHRSTGARPVPFLHVHGRNDNFVKYSCFGQIRDEMVARNGCNPVPEVFEVPGKYTKSVYKAQSGGFPYVTYEVNALGHWYSHGNLNNGNTSELFWDFFKDYTLLSSCDATLRWRLNIDTPGFDPELHNWDVTNRIYYSYGRQALQNNADNNVYPSLQLAPGNYYMTFTTTGNASNRMKVSLEALDGSRKYFSKSAQVGGTVVIPFTVSGTGIQQMRLRILKATATDKFTSMEIHTNNTGRAATGTMNDEDFNTPSQSGWYEELSQTAFHTDSGFYGITPSVENGINVYRADGNNHFAFKIENIDVQNCDYVEIRFAEPINYGWYVAYSSGISFEPIPAGTRTYRYYLPAGMTTLPQLTLMTYIAVDETTTLWENSDDMELPDSWHEYVRLSAAEAQSAGFSVGHKIKFTIESVGDTSAWPQALLSGPGWDPYPGNVGVRGLTTAEITITEEILDKILANGVCIRGDNVLFSKIEHFKPGVSTGVTYIDSQNNYQVVAKVTGVYKHHK